MTETWRIFREEDNDEIYYTVNWSPWGEMDRWTINRRVPAEAGLYQIWVRKSKSFLLHITNFSYFGGLRNSLREAIDELAPGGKKLRKLIRESDCRFRFSTYSHKDYLIELHSWFESGGGEDEDGRVIIVNENDDLHYFKMAPPDIKKSEIEELHKEYGPQLPPEGRRLDPPVWRPPVQSGKIKKYG